MNGESRADQPKTIEEMEAEAAADAEATTSAGARDDVTSEKKVISATPKLVVSAKPVPNTTEDAAAPTAGRPPTLPHGQTWWQAATSLLSSGIS